MIKRIWDDRLGPIRVNISNYLIQSALWITQTRFNQQDQELDFYGDNIPESWDHSVYGREYTDEDITLGQVMLLDYLTQDFDNDPTHALTIR